jgi:hypothetical protein
VNITNEWSSHLLVASLLRGCCSSLSLGVTRAERVGPDYYDVKEVYIYGKRPQFGNSLFGAQLL